jgi:hypothetical protein
MTIEDAELPDSPAEEEIPFAIYDSENRSTFSFQPLYYPETLRVVTDKELNRTDGGCSGENVSIKKLKNSDVHVKGKIHESDLPDLHELRLRSEPVEIVTPAIQGGGLECIIKKAEQGDVLSWDAYPDAQEWMFEYTLDLVSTGRDEYTDNVSQSRFEKNSDGAGGDVSRLPTSN